MDDGRALSRPSVFVLYRDSALRRASLEAAAGSAERYWLFGADQLAERGFRVRHSLEPGLEPRRRHRESDEWLRRAVRAYGGYEGDFATVLAARAAANRADVVFSTVDTVGIPLVLLARARVVRTPIVYASIALLDRIAQLRTERARRLYEAAFARVAALVAYGHAEAEALRAWLDGRPAPPPVHFVPFGVDAEYFRPEGGVEPAVDVVSVGGDPQRDYPLLLEVARRFPERSFSIVASAHHARVLEAAPANVSVETDVPFAEIRGRLGTARVVALPVRENAYSGATTTLLQAMAMAKPVVVSRTAAIAQGYGLEDGRNCRLVAPGDAAAFGLAISRLLADGEAAAALGARARETVAAGLTWDDYVDRLAAILAIARRP